MRESGPADGVPLELTTAEDSGTPFSEVPAVPVQHTEERVAGRARDSGGDDVSVFYDPMLAKLIVRGADREAARMRLLRALGEWQTVGAPTNVPFMARVAATPEFAAGEVHTAFIEQHSDDLLPKVPPPPSPNALQLAGLAWLTTKADELAATLPCSCTVSHFSEASASCAR